MDTTTSADGTTIAYDRTGSGPPLVLVVGAFCDRRTTKALTALLADEFTVFEYDRRGRGSSGDTPPYTADREVEDLRAVLTATGGPAAVYGHSSGAVLALEAAARHLPVSRVLAYEPPFTAVETGDTGPGDLAARVCAHLAAGRRAEAVGAFLTAAVGVPAEALPMVQAGPDWPAMLAIAHTLPYDLAICGDGRAPAERLARIEVPTLVVDGADSPAWAAGASRAVVAVVPGAERRTIAGQNHGVAPEAIAPVITAFLGQQ